MKTPNKPQYKRSISQLFQDSQKSTNSFVKMTGHAMMHVLGGNVPPASIKDELFSKLDDFRSNKFFREDYILIREMENKMNIRMEEYCKCLK